MCLKHLVLVSFFIVVPFYLSNAGVLQSMLQVCISYNGTDVFLNAKWNLDQTTGLKINITYSNATKMSKLTNLPLRGLPITSSLLRVKSCIKTSKEVHCLNTLSVVQPLYNVKWKRVNSAMLQFTCEVACRTEIIVGCAVTLTSGQTMLFGNSTNVKGNLRTFEPRLVMIDMPNINSDLQYSYSARALIVGSDVYPNSLGGFILPSTRIRSTKGTIVQAEATPALNSVMPTVDSSSGIAITATDYHSKPTSTPSTDGQQERDTDSMESQSTTIILIIVTVIMLPLCVILATIIAVLVSRKYFIRRSQNTTISVSAPIDNDMTDVDMQENPSYRVVKQTHSHSSNTDYYYI